MTIERRPTREEAIANAGAALAEVLAAQDALSPRRAAERAHRPEGPSVAELEDLIRAERGLPTKHGTEPIPAPPERVAEKPPRRVHRKRGTTPPPAPAPPPGPPRITPGGSKIAALLAPHAALSPREAAEAVIRENGAGGPTVDELEDIACRLRGLPMPERERSAIELARPGYDRFVAPDPIPAPVTAIEPLAPPVSAPPRPKETAKPDPLAAVAGMTLEQKRALAAALAAELGD